MAFAKRDYYEVLGVPRTASAEEIQHAFRASARELHPDVNSDHDAAARFDELTTAYAVLHDPRERARYDRSRLGARRGSLQVREAQAVTRRRPRPDVRHLRHGPPTVKVSLVIRVRNPFSRLR